MLVHLAPNSVALSTDRLGLYCLQFFDSKSRLQTASSSCAWRDFLGKKRKKKKAFILTKREWSQEELCVSPLVSLPLTVGSQAKRPDQSSAACCQPFATTAATSPAKRIRIPFPLAQACGDLPSACPTTTGWYELGKGTTKPFWGQETIFFVVCWRRSKWDMLCWSVFIWLSPPLRQWC